MINRRFTKGLNLIELLLVLGIISILIIAAFFMFPNVRAEVNANKELKNVAAIQSNIEGKQDVFRPLLFWLRKK